MMIVKRKDHESVTLFELQGDLGKNEARQLKDLLETLLEEKRFYIILDLENVRFMDSQAIIILLRMNREFLSSGGAIKLLRPRKVVIQFMSIGNVLDLFERYETKIEAIRSFDKNIKQKEVFNQEVNILEQAGRNQRMVLIRLIEILIKKNLINYDEYNDEITRSTQLVFQLFRKELETH